jgi:hypothetical protein
MKGIKDKIERVSQKLEITNKEIIQKCDFLFTNKINTFKKEIDRKIEEIRIPKSTSLNKENIDLSPLEQEVKKSQELSNQIKENLEKEINDLKMLIKDNKETIDANYLLINKQKDDINVFRDEFEELNNDVKNLKIKSKNLENLNREIISRNKSSRKLVTNETFSDKSSIKNKNVQKIVFKDLLNENNIDNDTDNNIISKKSNKNIKKMKSISKEKSNIKRKLTFVKEDLKKNDDNKRKDEVKIKKLNKNIKKLKSLTNTNNEKNKLNFDNDESEQIIQRKNIKKLLTYCFKSTLKLEPKENNNDKELELSSSSFSLLNEKDNNKQFDKKIK